MPWYANSSINTLTCRDIPIPDKNFADSRGTVFLHIADLSELVCHSWDSVYTLLTCLNSSVILGTLFTHCWLVWTRLSFLVLSVYTLLTCLNSSVILGTLFTHCWLVWTRLSFLVLSVYTCWLVVTSLSFLGLCLHIADLAELVCHSWDSVYTLLTWLNRPTSSLLKWDLTFLIRVKHLIPGFHHANK